MIRRIGRVLARFLNAGFEEKPQEWVTAVQCAFQLCCLGFFGRLYFTSKAEPPLGSGLDSAVVVNSVRSGTAAAVGEMNLDAFKTKEGNCIYCVCH